MGESGLSLAVRNGYFGLQIEKDMCTNEEINVNRASFFMYMYIYIYNYFFYALCSVFRFGIYKQTIFNYLLVYLCVCCYNLIE